jgi:DNA-3-methyladenine glycosylase
MDSFEVLRSDSVAVARRLLGSYLVRELDGQQLIVKIVETEAYHQTDPASHSYKGRTPRTDVMFGPAGHVYVYFTYGMHYCMNVVTGERGEGSAVLIRAVEPLQGEELMRANRRGLAGVQITNGPAKLCQALKVDKAMNGHDLHLTPLQLILQPAVPATDIITTTRIGISKAKDEPWRFYLKDNPYVSKAASKI